MMTARAESRHISAIGKPSPISIETGQSVTLLKTQINTNIMMKGTHQMTFKKFCSIENAYNTKFINKIREECYEFVDKPIWVVTEKIHGANFSFMLNEYDELVCCKRSGVILPDEKFYTYQEIVRKYGDNIKRMIKDLSYVHHTLNIQVYGELYGGGSPNNQVKPIFSPIQKEVFYTPKIEFAMFQICINSDTWLYKSEVMLLGSEFGVPCAPILFTGTLDDALKYNNEFNSIVARNHGYVFDNNTCEGVVIEPTIPMQLSIGARVIIKNKNSKFTERKSTPKTFNVNDNRLDENTKQLLTEVESLINMNRVNAVTSKIGEITQKDIGKVIGLTSKDVLDELDKLTQYSENLTDTQISQVNKTCNKLVSNFIKAHLSEIIK